MAGYWPHSFFCEFMDLDFVTVHELVKKGRLGQYQAILTSHMVNHPYLLLSTRGVMNDFKFQVFNPYLETLSGRRQSITNKLFNSITCNSDHKLHVELLPPRNNCEFNLRRKKNFHVPLVKTKRLKNTFIYSNCN